MPSRIVRDGYLKSRRVDALSDPASLFYTRLLLVVDDYGRVEFDPLALLSDTFPLRHGKYSLADFDGWMRECTTSSEPGAEPLLMIYSSGKKRYIQVNDFRQRVRAASKCPPPPGISDPVFEKGRLLRAGTGKVEVAPPLFAAAAALPDNDGHCQALSASRARTQPQSHTSSHTPPEAEAPQAASESNVAPWPESAAVVQEFHPGADILPEIANAARAACPEVTDPELAEVLRRTHQSRRQKSAGLWLCTVPTYLRGRPPRRSETVSSADPWDGYTAAELRERIAATDELIAAIKDPQQVQHWNDFRHGLVERLAELEETTQVKLANTG